MEIRIQAITAALPVTRVVILPPIIVEIQEVETQVMEVHRLETVELLPAAAHRPEHHPPAAMARLPAAAALLLAAAVTADPGLIPVRLPTAIHWMIHHRQVIFPLIPDCF